MHSETPFAEIAAKHASIICVDGDDMVRGDAGSRVGFGVAR